MGFGSHATFVVTKLPTLGPNTRRNLAAFPIASRVRRKRQRLRSNRLIESAAARFHISRYSSAAALPISPSVSRPLPCAHAPRTPIGERCASAQDRSWDRSPTSGGPADRKKSVRTAVYRFSPARQLRKTVNWSSSGFAGAGLRQRKRWPSGVASHEAFFMMLEVNNSCGMPNSNPV